MLLIVMTAGLVEGITAIMAARAKQLGHKHVA
jgi:hypothetical protein